LPFRERSYTTVIRPALATFHRKKINESAEFGAIFRA